MGKVVVGLDPSTCGPYFVPNRALRSPAFARLRPSNSAVGSEESSNLQILRVGDVDGVVEATLQYPPGALYYMLT